MKTYSLHGSSSLQTLLLTFLFGCFSTFVFAQTTTPTIALQSDTGASDTDGITNDATIAISDLEIGSTYEFSREIGEAVNTQLI